MDADPGWVLLGLFSSGLLALAGLMYRSVVKTLEEMHKQDPHIAEPEPDDVECRPARMTGDDVIKLAAQIFEPVHVWARPNPSATWTLIPIQPANSRGIEYGMRSWEFFGPICPPKEPL